MPASRADPSGYRQNGFTLKYAFVVRPSFGWKTLLLPLLTLGLILGHPTPSAASTTFDSINFWTGTGTNRAAMVIQWNDGSTPTSMVWGYRWSGEATGIDMLKAIAGSTVSREDGQTTFMPDTSTGADPRLALSLVNYSWGIALEGLVFTDREVVRTQNDWSTGYWEYSIFGGTFNYPLYDENWNDIGDITYSQTGNDTYSNVNWFSSPIGASDRILVDGSWDAFSFAADFTSTPVVEPSPPLPPSPTAKSIRLKSSTELEIIFTTTPNISYQLESKEDLLALEWSFQGSSFSAASAETTLIIPIQSNNPKKFFRLRQLP
jgi:hypothetical protein